jgi:hypothetical protein
MQSAAMTSHVTKHSVWTPLSTESCIRILTLSKAGPNNFPADAAFTISCSLVETDLDRPTSTADAFDAISYVWGSPDKIESIICNGSEVYIRRNLYLALCYIWSANPQKRLWADAICIDQDDNEEKSRQVALMNQIYSKAKCVIIWLGEPDILVESAWELIRDPINNQHLFSWWSSVLDGLATLLENEWFYRIWTYQELFLSQSAVVRCGHLAMPWEVFYRNCSDFTAHSTYQPKADQVMLHRMILSDKEGNFRRVFISDFTMLLIRTRHRVASDPRDKIYAILGLPMVQNTVRIRPDYAKSVNETYAQAALECIQQDANLSILSGAGKALEAQIGKDQTCTVPEEQQRTLNHRPGVRAAAGDFITLKNPIFSPDYLTLTLKRTESMDYYGKSLPSWVPRFDQPLAMRKVEEDGERAWSNGLCITPFRASLFRLHSLGASLMLRGLVVGTAVAETEDYPSFLPLPTCLSRFITIESVEPQTTPADVHRLLSRHHQHTYQCLSGDYRDWRYGRGTILDDPEGGELGQLGDWIVILYGAFDHCILRPFKQPSNLASEGSEEAIDLRFTIVTMAKRTWRHIKGVDLTQRPGIVLDFEIH